VEDLLAQGSVPEKKTPHYSLDDLRRAIDDKRILVTKPANEGAWDAGFDSSDIPDCLRALQPDDFHKAQAHEVVDDVWLDIYRPRYRNRDMYVKFHEDTFGRPDRFVIRSFKIDESPWTKRREEER